MKLIAYQVESHAPEIRVGQPRREWMDESYRRYAYLCLPLTTANRSGWELLNPVAFTAVWDGGEKVDALQIIDCEEPERMIAQSHFGQGILTFSTGYIFRTDSGHNLHAGGPPNSPKDGIYPLEGIIETDWLPYTFTMNWMLTRAGLPVRFEAGEPFSFIQPLNPRNLEDWDPTIQILSSNPELESEYLRWSRSRRRFNVARNDPTSDEARQGWAKLYLQGHTPDLKSHQERPIKRQLRTFRRLS